MVFGVFIFCSATIFRKGVELRRASRCAQKGELFTAPSSSCHTAIYVRRASKKTHILPSYRRFGGHFGSSNLSLSPASAWIKVRIRFSNPVPRLLQVLHSAPNRVHDGP